MESLARTSVLPSGPSYFSVRAGTQPPSTASLQTARFSQALGIQNPTHRRCFLPGRTRAQSSDAGAAAPPAEAGPEAPKGKPEIALQFEGPGGAAVASFTLGSGEKNLRRAMLDSKTPLYDMYGSLMNCGGGGSCGTCLVDIKEGADLLSPRTEAEEKYLKKRPDTWRLACQTIVGDKTNSGTLVVRTMPQKN